MGPSGISLPVFWNLFAKACLQKKLMKFNSLEAMFVFQKKAV